MTNLPSKKITLTISDFFTRKKFCSIVLQVVCDANKIFWNFCVGQLGGVHDDGQFKKCNIYEISWNFPKTSYYYSKYEMPPVFNWSCSLSSLYILAKEMKKIYHFTNLNKIIYDFDINSRKAIIENAFDSLTNMWWLLKHFNSRVDKASPITIVYCVLHNYHEMWGASKPRLANARIKGDNLIEFSVDRLYVLRKGKRIKSKSKKVKN